MSGLGDTNSLIAVARAVKDKNSNIRLGAINGAINIKKIERWRILSPLLQDKVLAVRTEAVRALMPLWQQLSALQQQRLQPALDDYLTIQQFNADRGFSHSNTGNMYAHQGKYDQAEKSYYESLRIEPNFTNAYVNLAELYRRQQQNNLAIDVLRQGIKANPDDSSLTYALGLAYIRNKQNKQASHYFKKSIELAPNNLTYHYIYSLSLAPFSPGPAQQAMRATYRLSHNPQHLYALCEMQIRYHAAAATQCLDELAAVAPTKAVTQLRQQLNQVIKVDKKEP